MFERDLDAFVFCDCWTSEDVYGIHNDVLSPCRAAGEHHGRGTLIPSIARAKGNLVFRRRVVVLDYSLVVVTPKIMPTLFLMMKRGRRTLRWNGLPA